MGYIYFTGNIYFITCKTAAGFNYFQEPWAKQIIKEQIGKAQNKFQTKIYGYAILSNHYHLLIQSNHWRDIPKFLQIINGGSSYLLNKRLDVQHGGIWMDKWTKKADTKESSFRILGYILGNRYKHGLVKNLQELYEYPFSSYKTLVTQRGAEYVDNLIMQTIALDLDLETEERYIESITKK